MIRVIRVTNQGNIIGNRRIIDVRINEGVNNIGPKGQMNTTIRQSDKRQRDSNSASKSIGQGPKDKVLEALDAIANRDTPKNKVIVRKGKPSKNRGHDKVTKRCRRRESTKYRLPAKSTKTFRPIDAILASEKITR